MGCSKIESPPEEITLMLTTTYYQEHPFAQYVRILGKGKNGSRSLTQEEAFTAGIFEITYLKNNAG